MDPLAAAFLATRFGFLNTSPKRTGIDMMFVTIPTALSKSRNFAAFSLTEVILNVTRKLLGPDYPSSNPGDQSQNISPFLHYLKPDKRSKFQILTGAFSVFFVLLKSYPPSHSSSMQKCSLISG